MKDFLKEFFSVREERTSFLIIGGLATLIVALVVYGNGGDITGNMKDLLIAFIASIAGTNIVPNISSFFNRNKEE